MMVVIEPLGTGELLPALVIGYELAGAADHARVRGWEGAPEGMLILDQQAGGYSMYYPSVAGFVLRLADNRQRLQQDGEFLIRGFQAMAEDPDWRLLRREYPVLRELCGTHQEYSAEQLRALERFLSPFLTTPRVEAGWEAFIRFAPCDLLDYFAGWRLLQVSVPAAPSSGCQDQHGPTVDESNFRELTLTAERELDSAALQELLRLGDLLGQPLPRAFLLWENCD